MPELRKKRPQHFTPTEFEVDKLRYKDLNREKQRQINLKVKAEHEPSEEELLARKQRFKQGRKNEAW